MFDFSKGQTFAEEESANLFQQFFLAFLQAQKNISEAVEVYIRVAKTDVCLRFAGKNLARQYARALRHIQTDIISNPDFTICVWDSETSGQSLPPFLDQFNQFINSHPNAGLRAIRGDVPLLTNNIIRTALVNETALTIANPGKKLCVHWVQDAREIPYHEAGAPLRVPFNFMFGNVSRQLLHGGAVGTGSGGVFLGGIGGSGKSTTALNCISSSLYYASDDYVVVDVENQLTAYSLYSTAKVKTMKDLERFPEFSSWVANEEGVKFNEEKPLMFLNEHVPQKLIFEIPLKAIVFPRFVAGEEIRYQPMSQQRVFREIVTSTVRQTPNDDQTAISMIGRFIKELPCYELIFGEAQQNLPDYITEIITLNS